MQVDAIGERSLRLQQLFAKVRFPSISIDFDRFSACFGLFRQLLGAVFGAPGGVSRGERRGRLAGGGESLERRSHEALATRVAAQKLKRLRLFDWFACISGIFNGFQGCSPYFRIVLGAYGLFLTYFRLDLGGLQWFLEAFGVYSAYRWCLRLIREAVCEVDENEMAFQELSQRKREARWP